MSTLEYLYEKIKNILIKFTSWWNFETKAIFIARGTAQSSRIQCGTRAARRVRRGKCLTIYAAGQAARRAERGGKFRAPRKNVLNGARTAENVKYHAPARGVPRLREAAEKR